MRRVAATPRVDRATSSIVIAELLGGAHRNRARSEALFASIRGELFGGFTILAFDAACAESYGYVSAHLETTGAPIGDMDTLIAATALAYGLTVVTGNERHFGRVPSLEVENWIA